MHLVAGDDRTVRRLDCHPVKADGPEGRKLLKSWENKPKTLAHLIMDTAYEGDKERLDPRLTRWCHQNRIVWSRGIHDRERYRKRHEVEIFLGYRSIFVFRKVGRHVRCLYPFCTHH